MKEDKDTFKSIVANGTVSKIEVSGLTYLADCFHHQSAFTSRCTPPEIPRMQPSLHGFCCTNMTHSYQFAGSMRIAG